MEDPLDLLEELLALTEPLKDEMTPEDRAVWSRISAEAADIRQSEV
jgi:hypothetical protein